MRLIFILLATLSMALSGCIKTSDTDVTKAAILEAKARWPVCKVGDPRATIVDRHQGKYVVEVKCYDDLLKDKLRVTVMFMCTNGWRVSCDYRRAF